MSQAPEVCTIDFETKPAEGRPAYPPEPVGVAIRAPWMRESHYYAWNHPTGNNCTPDEAMEALDRVWESGLPILTHGGKFDLAIAYEKLGAARVPWQRVHDTMFLAFLVDPHARNLGLKELAQEWLDWPAEERDAMGEWLWEHRKNLRTRYDIKLSRSQGRVVNPSKWTAYVPGQIAGMYARGDVDRTQGLFDELWPIVQDNGMGEAYDRERRLMPILMENEERGMRVDLGALDRDAREYEFNLRRAETWLTKKLKVDNLDADRDVANALLSLGIVPEENWSYTDGGASGNKQLCMKKDVLLPEHFSGPGGAAIASALGYRNRLTTCMKMFMVPWLGQAQKRDGYISTNWNQTRGADGGTRTGRPSTSSPNFLNISKSWDTREDGYVHPDFLKVAPLPLVRSYVLPDEGDEFLHRDFDGQELRVFAHFEQGALMRAYLADAKLDPHAFVGKTLMDLTGIAMDRTKIKVMNFQSLYGGGITAIMNKLHCTRKEATEYKDFHNQALPGRKLLDETIKEIVRTGAPIRTWGGRLYFPEEPRIIKGRRQTWEYKLINYLVQGSAADITKQALCEWYDHPERVARFLVTVYDEINISSPLGQFERQMRVLRETMNDNRLDVPMLSSGKRGASWGALEKCA